MAQLTGVKKMVVAIAAVFASAGAAIPAPNATALSMQTGAITSQPIGHYEFCQSHRSECEIKSKSSTAPRVTDFGWSVIREANLTVNRDMTPITDQDLFGKDEVWAYPDRAGDCEDFVLLKRKNLMQKGFCAVRPPDHRRPQAGWRGPCGSDRPHGPGRFHPGQSRQRGEALDEDALPLLEAPGLLQHRPLGHHRKWRGSAGRLGRQLTAPFSATNVDLSAREASP